MGPYITKTKIRRENGCMDIDYVIIDSKGNRIILNDKEIINLIELVQEMRK